MSLLFAPPRHVEAMIPVSLKTCGFQRRPGRSESNTNWHLLMFSNICCSKTINCLTGKMTLMNKLICHGLLSRARCSERRASMLLLLKANASHCSHIVSCRCWQCPTYDFTSSMQICHWYDANLKRKQRLHTSEVRVKAGVGRVWGTDTKYTRKVWTPQLPGGAVYLAHIRIHFVHWSSTETVLKCRCSDHVMLGEPGKSRQIALWGNNPIFTYGADIFLTARKNDTRPDNC